MADRVQGAVRGELGRFLRGGGAIVERFLQKNNNKDNKLSNPTTGSQIDPTLLIVIVLCGLCFCMIAWQWCCATPRDPLLDDDRPRDRATGRPLSDEEIARRLARTPPRPPGRPLAFERSRSRPRMPRTPPLAAGRAIMPLGAIHTPGGTLDMDAHRAREAENARMLAALRARRSPNPQRTKSPNPSAVVAFVEPDGSTQQFGSPSRSGGYAGAAMQRRMLHSALGGAVRSSPAGPPTSTYRMPEETAAMAAHRARHAENERMLAVIRAREVQARLAAGEEV